MSTDVVVLGAGAAGMMCAATAGRRGRRVVLVDHWPRLAEKIRISGGGRCNFTNLNCRPEAFLSRNPHFCRSALARYGPRDFVALVERHRVRYHEKTLGQLFCDGRSEEIIGLLQRECDAAQVRWARPASVLGIERRPGPQRFAVHTSQGRFDCASLVVATGGLAAAKTGASPLGYRIAGQFGLPVVPTRPALVPLAAPPDWRERYSALAGASLDARVSCAETQFREALLFTHRGLSGPAVLQISSYWQQAGGQGEIGIDLLPGVDDAAAWLDSHRGARGSLASLLSGPGAGVPRRVAHAWCEAHGWDRPLSQLSRPERDAIAKRIQRWPFRPSGTLGFDKAEVTLGGVDTDALSQQTMEARAVPGLYFAGEVMDVTGWLGGYNFQWAWSSGFAAGQSA